MDPDQQLRNLRDFLLVYNRMTEICFQRCTSNFNYRNLTMNEDRCVDNCAGKLIRSNHRMMSTYVQLMPRMVQRRVEEMESKAAENAKAAEAAATGALESAGALAEASPTSETPAISSALPQVSQSAPNFGLETQGSVLKSAAIDIPVEMDTPVSQPATASEISLSATTSLIPATDSVLNSAGSGPSDTSGFSHPSSSSAGAQKEPTSPALEFIPSKPIPITAVIPAPDAAATVLSKNKESSLEQAVAPKVPPVSDQ